MVVAEWSSATRAKEIEEMSVLSTEDRTFWKENGYVVIPNAVPPEQVRSTEQKVWDFLGMSPDHPESWYPNPPRASVMVEMYQDQALWDNRQYPRVYQAFAEIFGTEKLWVSIDRASMNPPERDDWKYPGGFHWDTSLDLPIKFWVQGVLYLTDTAANQGAFSCVPGFHRKIEAWLKDLPPDADPRQQDIESLGVRPIPGKAGDLIIWHSALPHGSSPNTANLPRVAQYITMYPAQEEDQEARDHRIEAWRDRLAGLVIEVTGKCWELRREKEHELGRTAKLSPLGRTLLGLDLWEDTGMDIGADRL